MAAEAHCTNAKSCRRATRWYFLVCRKVADLWLDHSWFYHRLHRVIVCSSRGGVMRLSRISVVTSIALAQGGCGLGVAQLPEVWDRSDPAATANMEMQIKKAIFCQLQAGASNPNLPPTWGAQVTLTLTADEKSSLTPNVSFKEPIS